MRKGIIIINGELSDISKLRTYISPADVVIAADGGANIAVKANIIPHVVIGDLDSITPETKDFLTQNNTSFIPYPPEKDFTDSELAIQYAIEQSYDELIICGILGDRLDHMLANVFHIAQIAQKTPLTILNGNQEVTVFTGSKTIKGVTNDTLSLIPLSQDCKGITTSGLYYKLSNENLPLGSTRGISNVFTENEAKVTCNEGTLLAIHTKEDPSK